MKILNIISIFFCLGIFSNIIPGQSFSNPERTIVQKMKISEIYSRFGHTKNDSFTISNHTFYNIPVIKIKKNVILSRYFMELYYVLDTSGKDTYIFVGETEDSARQYCEFLSSKK